MALSKKDYIELARVLRANRPSKKKYTQFRLWHNIVFDLTSFLKRDNVRFDHDKFYDACNVYGE